MMRVLIIEDEKPAAEKLQKALLQCHPGISIEAVLSGVADSVNWLQEKAMPDLVFMDISLSDGLSFKIFEKVNINCPVIFTTAFDDYWQEAFECNSIDYLLKPVKEEKLRAALQKYEMLRQHFTTDIKNLLSFTNSSRENNYRKRFLVKRGTDFISIKTEDIAYFYAAHKLVCLVDIAGRKFILDQSLTDIEQQVAPEDFYRVNRKYLVQVNAIKRIKAHAKSKLLLEVEPEIEEEIVISQENVTAFKQWMDR